MKAKFKKVATQLAGPEGSWVNTWKWVKGPDGKYHRYFVANDRTQAVRRIKIIEKNAARMAHHPRHQCEICRLGPKELKHRHEREVARKSPEIDDGED